MAITVLKIDSGSGIGPTVTTNNASAAANSLLVVFVAVNNLSTLSVTGFGGLPFTNQRGPQATGSLGLWVFTAPVGPITTSGTLTITTAGGSADVAWQTLYVLGHNLSSPISSSAGTFGTGTSGVYSFSDGGIANVGILHGWAISTLQSNVTPSAPYAEVFDSGAAYPVATLETQFLAPASGNTTVAASWPTSSGYTSVGVVISPPPSAKALAALGVG